MMPVVALIVLPFPVQMQRISSQSQLEKNFTSTLRRYTAVQQRTWADYLNLESNAAVAAVWYGHSQVACIKIVLCGSFNSVQLTTFLQVCDSVTFGAQIYWVSVKRMPRRLSLRAEVARPGASMSKMAVYHICITSLP
ncbi:hypothetical protein BGY98DRAFT_677983 [Russula aff. rugulosa BPL654]|nr:hypothetical protein BGY98DRAFT_677983 [Russula aff. rugulosa BPL654]